jgi:uncharacterized phiE125 gp8 family phage protein
VAIRVVTGPAVEPITIDDLKNDLKVDADLTEDDALIRALGIAARRVAESIQNRALITQTLELALDEWPCGNTLEIPRPPLQSVTSITYYDEDDTGHTLDPGSYSVDTYSQPGRVVLNADQSWPDEVLRPANGVIVQFVAGYGDEESEVPETTVQAIRLLVGHWYENREAVSSTGAIPKEVPFGVMSLLWLDRVGVV